MKFESYIQDHIVSVEDQSDELFQRLRVTFRNGYGASVIRGTYSQGGDVGLFEVGVLDDEGNLVYDTPVTDDVIAHLDGESVAEVFEEIMTLPPRGSVLEDADR